MMFYIYAIPVTYSPKLTVPPAVDPQTPAEWDYMLQKFWPSVREHVAQLSQGIRPSSLFMPLYLVRSARPEFIRRLNEALKPYRWRAVHYSNGNVIEIEAV